MPDARARRLLSLNQSAILDHLDSREPTHLHSLAAHMGVTASTMSLNVDRLERAGYVSRNRDDDDARRVELRLTESGNELKQRQHVLEPERVRRLLRRLSPAQREQALGGLRLLAGMAKEITERPDKIASPASGHGVWGGAAQTGGPKTKRSRL